jgi:diguanylate cyclase (GGDEF)-like protein/PAS domain S-box-containing protein
MPVADYPATLILEGLADAVSIIGPDGVHLHTNAAACAILDDLRARHEGRPVGDFLWDTIDADGRPLPNDRLPVEITRLTGEECSGVEIGFPAAAAGDDVRWLRISTRRLDAERLPCTVLASFADVTEARRNTEELRRERERYRTVAHALHEGLVILDTEARIIAANSRAEEMLGLQTDGLTGRRPTDASWRPVGPDGLPLATSDLATIRVLATGEPEIDRLMGVHTPEGDLRWLRVNATPLHNLDGSLSGVVSTFKDVSEQRAEREELSRATKLFSTAFAEAPNGMALVGLDGRWLKVNHEICRIVGYSESELLERTFQDITHPEDLDADLALLNEVLDGKRRQYQLRKRYIRSDGRVIWVLLSVSLVLDEAGAPLHFISHVEDVTERRELELRLQRLAERDDLTGLLNRRRFEEQLTQQLARCKRHDECAALAMIDLDGFKRLNDTQGHAAGDRVLRAVAAGLSERVRETDTVARLGGDEFAVLLVGADDVSDIAAWLAAAATVGTGRSGVSASVGVTELHPGDTPDEALARADHEMYEIKRARPARSTPR